ncbi:hypothetical protein [Streptomyces sp. WAC 01325]|uniref:hypothetical protein n=1 Tax=Streptomyces sp. WAC 01325 TaxID=2203202 RepID=UPI00163CFB85|nr:hypothetical protein [Streptomyces sp. WAC 01325]
MSTAAALKPWAAAITGTSRDRLAGWRSARRRRRAESRTWHQARDLRELAVLTAQWC